MVCAHNSLYVAWLHNMAVSSTPLELLAAGQAPQAAPWGHPLRERKLRRPPGKAEWIFWDMALGPDGALYLAANPPYETEEGGAYGDLPAEPGRGFVARLALDDRGEQQPGWRGWPPRGACLASLPPRAPCRAARWLLAARPRAHPLRPTRPLPCLPQASCAATWRASRMAHCYPAPAGCALTMPATCL